MEHLTAVSDNVYRGQFTNEEEAIQWLVQYEEETSTTWRVKSSLQNSSRFIFRKTFVCHHSDHKRVKKEENKKGNSKNTGCQAELSIKIKLTTRDTERKDAYVKGGYPAIITMKGDHNHALSTAESASFLRPRNEMKSRFESYFDSGMGIKESIDFHKTNLELEFGVDKADFANARINPKYRTVQNWFNRWKANSENRIGTGSTEVQDQHNVSDADYILSKVYSDIIKIEDYPLISDIDTTPNSDTDMKIKTETPEVSCEDYSFTTPEFVSVTDDTRRLNVAERKRADDEQSINGCTTKTESSEISCEDYSFTTPEFVSMTDDTRRLNVTEMKRSDNESIYGCTMNPEYVENSASSSSSNHNWFEVRRRKQQRLLKLRKAKFNKPMKTGLLKISQQFAKIASSNTAALQVLAESSKLQESNEKQKLLILSKLTTVIEKLADNINISYNCSQ